MYKVLYIQCAHFIILLYILPIQFAKEFIQLYIFDIHNFSKNVHNSTYLMCIIFWCVKIFLLKLLIVLRFIYAISKPLKNVHNYVYYTYTSFKRMYTILYIHCTQFFKDHKKLYIFNVHRFSKNVHNSTYLMCIIFWYVKFFFSSNY